MKRGYKMKSGLLIRIFLLVMIGSGVAALAAEEPKLERIGGNFTVTKIQKLPKGGFSVDFKSSDGKPSVSRLHLESDHINAGLTEGDTLRLSAEVLSKKGDSAEISQVVVFLPGRSGPTPVWMLSKKSGSLLPPAKLIEMHAPSTDYAVF